MVLVESMACGLPVVAANCVAGPSEVLLNGKCGILVPVADEEALARGIISLLTDTALRERLISVAMERVSDFEPAKVIASYEQLFLELCNDRGIQDPVPATS
jgi:glycosyltransferase involved in cell wall biosynthesis